MTSKMQSVKMKAFDEAYEMIFNGKLGTNNIVGIHVKYMQDFVFLSPLIYVDKKNLFAILLSNNGIEYCNLDNCLIDQNAIYTGICIFKQIFKNKRHGFIQVKDPK